MPALTIKGGNGQTAITYYGSIKLEIQAVGDISINRYGLAEGDVKWRVPTSLANKLSPALGITHPVVSYMVMEKLELAYDKDYTDITGHFVGAYPGAIAVYDYQPSFGEEPIQTHPNFGNAQSVANDGTIVGAAGGAINLQGFPNQTLPLTLNSGAIFNLDNSFKCFLYASPNNLGGVTAYLLNQGFYVKSTVSAHIPDCSLDGTISDPDGGPIPNLVPGANWIKAPTVFNNRGNVYDIRESWKASGRKGWNTIVYAS